MAKRRRKNGELIRDRRVIGDLYLKGWTQTAIGEELGLSQQTISRDIGALHKDWLVSSLVDFDKAKAGELAKIDLLEREAWGAKDWRTLKWCIDRRCKIFGLDAPEKRELTGKDGSPLLAAEANTIRIIVHGNEDN